METIKSKAPIAFVAFMFGLIFLSLAFPEIHAHAAKDCRNYDIRMNYAVIYDGKKVSLRQTQGHEVDFFVTFNGKTISGSTPYTLGNFKPGAKLKFKWGRNGMTQNVTLCKP